MEFADNDVLVVAGARTGFGSYGGSLTQVSLNEMTRVAITGALERAGLGGSAVQDVVVGNVIQSSSNAAYFARHSAMSSGIPQGVPAKITNRLCGSGMEAMVEVSKSLRLGEYDIGLAGGAEHMSQSPYVARGHRWGVKMGHDQLEDALTSALTDEYVDSIMGMTAENLADKYGISRQEQDDYAARSQTLAQKAQQNGRLAKEIVLLSLPNKKGEPIAFDQDEFIKGASIAEKLGKLKPVFKKDGSVTAGNSSGVNDGAVALILASGRAVREQNLPVMARVVSWGHAGVDPSIMGIGPVYAIRNALAKTDLSLTEIDLIEVNEAFAAQYLSVEKELDLDRDKVNVNGGAIALGHPLGASGGRISLTLLYEMQERQAKYGLASLCIGGGQGIAMVFENMSA